MRGSSWVPVLAGVVGVSIVVGCSHPPAVAPAAVFDLEEATIASLQQRMESGQDTARSLAEKYLARIDAIDRSGPTLKSVIEINPDALAIADALDAERKSKGPRGPLHGIPVLIKDNIATADHMQTTAGSLALEGSIAPADAFLVAQAARGGRGHPRQDQSQRVGQLPIDALVERLERTRRADAQSVRARPQSVGLELGIGRRGRREPRRGRDRHRDRRIDRLAVEQQRARRHQADGRPRQPLRHRARSRTARTRRAR